jgi:hypothetical protein
MHGILTQTSHEVGAIAPRAVPLKTLKTRNHAATTRPNNYSHARCNSSEMLSTTHQNHMAARLNATRHQMYLCRLHEGSRFESNMIQELEIPQNFCCKHPESHGRCRI